MWILDNQGSKCYNSENIISIIKGISFKRNAPKDGEVNFTSLYTIDIETIDDPTNPVSIATFEDSEIRDSFFEALMEAIEKSQKFFWFDIELIKKGK